MSDRHAANRGRLDVLRATQYDGDEAAMRTAQLYCLELRLMVWATQTNALLATLASRARRFS